MKSLRCTLIRGNYCALSNKGNYCVLSNKLPNQTKLNNWLRPYSAYSNITKEKQTARFFCTNNYSKSSIIQDRGHATDLNNITNPLSPWFITGLTDAEGSFSCIIKKNSAYKTG